MLGKKAHIYMLLRMMFRNQTTSILELVARCAFANGVRREGLGLPDPDWEIASLEMDPGEAGTSAENNATPQSIH